LDTLWDTFWEKHAAKWLEKTQCTISSLADNVKDGVKMLQEQIAKTFDRKLIDKGKENLPGSDAWLKEMKALRDDLCEKNPDWGKANRIEKSPSVVQCEYGQSISKVPPVSFDKPITDEQRVHYEEKFNKLMQAVQLQKDKQELLGKFDKLHSSTTKTKTMQKDNLDKEMEF
jgi:hypothetical protein